MIISPCILVTFLTAHTSTEAKVKAQRSTLEGWSIVAVTCHYLGRPSCIYILDLLNPSVVLLLDLTKEM